MRGEVSNALRRLVVSRAEGRCEYCLMPQSASAYEPEPDHIVPIQHGGATKSDNLALACLHCNRRKGPNVGSFDPETGTLVAFYNPRIHKWPDHFRLNEAEIEPLTPEARVTVKIFQLNDEQRLAKRKSLLDLGLYP